MTLYEIDNRLQELVDPETGEIADYEAFEALDMERNRKLENMACWIKNMKADMDSIATEVKVLQARKKVIENRTKRITAYLQEALAGQKFETPKCSITYRNSTAVVIGDSATVVEYLESHGHTDCITYAEPEINKNELKKLLNDGEVPGASLAKRQNMQIK